MYMRSAGLVCFDIYSFALDYILGDRMGCCQRYVHGYSFSITLVDGIGDDFCTSFSFMVICNDHLCYIIGSDIKYSVAVPCWPASKPASARPIA